MKSYLTGFALSVLLTLGAFWYAPHLGALAIPAIILSAIVQLLVQLVFFLHLHKGDGHESRVLFFSLTAIIIGILVGGTLWIMSNLNHLHVHSPSTTDIYQGGMVAPQNELH